MRLRAVHLGVPGLGLAALHHAGPVPVVVVGEALLDVLITADGSHQVPGGSCLNVAVGLHRLGVPVTLVTSYGDDEGGRALAEHLTGVEVVRFEGPTSRAIAELDEHGRAGYRFELTWDLGTAMPRIPTRSHLHVGSLGAVVQPGSETVLQLVLDHPGTTSFDPNCRPGFTMPERLEQLVALSDVVKLSDEDAALLYPRRAIEDVAQEWLTRGPELVVVTRGADGAEGWTREGYEHVPAPAGPPVVDSVGAGDSFMSALISAWLERRGLREALEHAALAARITCGREGAQPPMRSEMARVGV